MKISADRGTASHRIEAYGTGFIRVAQRDHGGPLLVAPERLSTQLTPPPPAALGLEDLAPALALAPQVLLLGTGASLIRPDQPLAEQCAAQGIGLEIMDTAAACRTYNVLMAEDRRVVALLFPILEPQGDGKPMTG